MNKNSNHQLEIAESRQEKINFDLRSLAGWAITRAEGNFSPESSLQLTQRKSIMDGESTIQSSTKEMKYNIGDALVCVNNQDSDSLELNEEYVVVDINEHGNIGLRHPSSGSLLRHYYKPERFDRIKQVAVKPVDFGQYYQRWNAIYLVAGIGGKYALVDIENGYYWDDPCDNIEKVFAGERDKFKQVNLDSP
jgi:hypothetical protein